MPEIMDAQFQGIYQQTTATMKPIRKEDVIESISTIPPIHTILEAKLRLRQNSDKNDWFALIVGYGYVAKDALTPLLTLHKMVYFVAEFRRFLRWLNQDSDDADGPFTRRLSRLILDQPGIMCYSFTSSYGVKTSLDSLMFLGGTEWIDDSVVDGVMETFMKKYGHQGTYLHVPTQILAAWASDTGDTEEPSIPWNFEAPTALDMVLEGRIARRANETKEVKAFAVLYLGGYWGAVCVDFVAEKLLIGDSLDNGHFSAHSDVLSLLKKWLQNCGIVVNDWNHDSLDVPYQDAASGSCGITALNTIERQYDPTVERWTSKRSRYHRIRLLRLLTEPIEVR